MSGTVGKQLIRFSETSKGNKNVSFLARTSFAIGLVLNTLFGPIVDMAAWFPFQGSAFVSSVCFCNLPCLPASHAHPSARPSEQVHGANTD